MEQLIALYRSLLADTETIFVRYLHDEIDWNARMIGIVGARGVGKTTLLLQHIKLFDDPEQTLFLSADDLYFSEHRLFDMAADFYRNGGKRLYIDEVHKYADWSKELKMMYDYFPKLQVTFTGSSVLDIYKGSADLSRRVLLYTLHGLSFREYLNLSLSKKITPYSLEEIISRQVELPDDISHPLPLYKAYLRGGYYPFFVEGNYGQRLRHIINITLETDIPAFSNMNAASVKKLKQLLYIISQSVPFKPNFTKIAQIMDVHRNQVTDYLYYLERAGIVMQLHTETKGIRALGKIEKVYLNNANLMYVLSDGTPDVGNIRETAFLNQMAVRHSVFASPVADFEINGYTFEVGGKNKTQKQLSGVTDRFVVKDDMEYGSGNVIPLWHFGMSY
ncbi:MAG: AAA family ATPase [Prevotellaceae bacterium]|jgi:predicted AAA+ superfamily ATPase|nr:AAA family ATPase [Prevotellaceae bacterium]